MSINREAIYVALFNLLKTQLASSLVTIGRRHIVPPDLSPAQQPALFVCGVGESKEPKPRGTPGKLTLHAMLFLYAYESAINEQPGQEQQLAATQINQLLAAIEDALAPKDPSGNQSLGGLVSHCWTEGNTDIDPGILSQQAVAFVPVHILVP
jgi:hypothetical protein